MVIENCLSSALRLLDVRLIQLLLFSSSLMELQWITSQFFRMHWDALCINTAGSSPENTLQENSRNSPDDSLNASEPPNWMWALTLL